MIICFDVEIIGSVSKFRYGQFNAATGSTMHLSLILASLDISVVDHFPEELLLLSLEGFTVEYLKGDSSGVDLFAQLHF